MKVVNILFFISFIKSKMLSLVSKIFKRNTKIDNEFKKLLIYPTEAIELDSWLLEINNWIEKNNPYGIQEVSHYSCLRYKQWLKKLEEQEIFNVHKYYNIQREFNRARGAFHEILRRQLKCRNIIFTKNGTKRYISTLMLISQMKNSKYVNSFRDKFFLKVLFFITSPSRNRDFYNLVLNKNISLIGGGSEVDKEVDINKADLVARLNTFELNETLIKNTGNRIDIVFMRSVRTKNLYQELGQNALEKYKNIFFNFKNKTLYSLFKSDNKTIAFNSNACFPHGGLNAIQGAIFELIYNGAEIIYLYGTDFHIISTHADGYYPKDMPKISFELTFGEHPSYTQFLITKYFVNRGFVIHNGDGAKVIDLNYRQFCRAFDSLYHTKRSNK